MFVLNVRLNAAGEKLGPVIGVAAGQFFARQLLLFIIATPSNGGASLSFLLKCKRFKFLENVSRNHFLRAIGQLVFVAMLLGLAVDQGRCQNVSQSPIRLNNLNLSSPAPTMTKKRMTPELLWQLQRLGETALSPDGNKIAYTVGSYDLQENAGTKSLRIIDLATGDEVTVLENWASISSVQWLVLEATQHVYFVGQEKSTEDTPTEDSSPTNANDLQRPSKPPIKKSSNETGENKPQAWRVDVNDGLGIAEKITSIAGGVSNLKLSPDAKRVAFTTRVKMVPNVEDVYPDLPKADARIIDSLMYRHWDKWDDYKFSHIHVADLQPDGPCENVFDLMAGIESDCPVGPWGGGEQFDWSPDGTEIAFTMKHIPNGTQWAQSTNTDVYVVEVVQPSDLTEAVNKETEAVNKETEVGKKETDATPKPRNITPAMEGYDRNPRYSPDGKWIAWSSMQRPGFEADRARVMLFNRETESTHELTAGMDQNAHHVVWAADSQSIFFDSEVQGTQQIFELPIQTKPGDSSKPEVTPVASPVAITSGRFHWTIVSPTGDGQSVLAKRSDMLRPDELFRVDRDTDDAVVITKINDDVYQTLELPTVEQHFVESTDGKQILTWVIRPAGFDSEASTRWPMLLYCQGGPQAQVGQNFSWRWNFHLMAAQGYVVVAPNRRGLPGFGQQWNDQISGDWGGQAMSDLLSVTDHFSSQGTIDDKRVAAVGASFGGYSIYWMMGHHEDRFAAMIAHCGVFNLESMYGSTEELFFVNWDLGGPYWDSDELQKRYRDFSPHQFVKQWDTPLLVIHGQQDFRVPVTQGMEAFTAAQVQDVPSRFLYFPEESHWVTSPQNSVLWHRVFFDWLDRHCVR